MACGCKDKKTPSEQQAARTAKRLEARATRQESVQKFQAGRVERMANQRRRPAEER